jgi:hypothetical protein
MRSTNVNNFLLLYNNNGEQYQPTSSWSLHDGFKLNELLHLNKREFIADELLNKNGVPSRIQTYESTALQAEPLSHSGIGT